MIAIGKYIRIKYKKALAVASMVQGKQVDEAMRDLRFIPKKASKIIYKVLKSAVSNAENNFKKNKENLIVETIIVNKGPELKRIRPVSRGRAHGITKGVSHVTVRLSEMKDVVEKKTIKKEKVKKEKDSKIVKDDTNKKITKINHG